MSELHVDESGTPGSEAVVFLHADGISGQMWADHMERLSEYHCLAPDLPGFGHSNHLNWQSLSHTADLVANLVREKIPARSVHLVGESLGGGVAHTLLARYSDILDTVIINGAGVLPYRFAPLVKLGVNLLSPFLHTKPVIEVTSRMFALDEQDKRDLLAASPDSFRRALNDANEQQLRNEELASPCRTLLVAGERDLPMVRPSNAALADLMPDATARYVPQHGHAWMNRKPDLHQRMVIAWITGSALPAVLERETSPWPRSKVNHLLDRDSTRST
jgi:pimeloyl-ACP methyl ester carboxylesterase